MNAIPLIAVLLAAFAVLLVSWESTSSQKHNPMQLAEPAFNRIFGALTPPPKLKVGWAYGYPTFEIMFGSKAEMEKNAALGSEFKRELNALFKDYGSLGRPFDAELAVFFTYPGHIDELVAAFRQKS